MSDGKITSTSAKPMDIAKAVADVAAVSATAGTLFAGLGGITEVFDKDFKKMASIMASIEGKTGPAASLLAKPASYWRQCSLALAFEEYPQFLGVKLQRARTGMPSEVDGVVRGGTEKWQSWWSGNPDDLNEVVHLSGFRRDEYGVHSSYAYAVDQWVARWSEDLHKALAAHMARAAGKEDEEAEKRAELDRAHRERADQLAREALERDRLAQEARDRVAREAAERELLEAVVFEEQISAGGGAW